MLTVTELHMLLALLIGEADMTEEYCLGYRVDRAALLAKLQSMREAAQASEDEE